MNRRHYRHDQIDGRAIFLSDTHFGHNNILLYDGRTQFFTPKDIAVYEAYKATGTRQGRISDEAVQCMNDFIIDSINAAVENPDRDTIVFGGDFVFGNSDNQIRRRAKEIRSRIKCQDMRIVWGNHDNPDLLCDLFTVCYDQALLFIGEQPVFINHFPMLAWNGPKGTIHLHGHVHGLYTRPGHPHPHARPNMWMAMDIGINTNNYQPYTLPVIQARLKPVRETIAAVKAEGNTHLLY